VIGGYTVGGMTFDAILVGYYEGDRLMYAAKVRAGFVAALREALFKLFAALHVDTCPFANLPESYKGRWGEGLTAAEMAECSETRGTRGTIPHGQTYLWLPASSERFIARGSRGITCDLEAISARRRVRQAPKEPNP